MGNSVTCFAPKKKLASSVLSRNSSVSWNDAASRNKASTKSRQQYEAEDALIREQALEALMLFKQHQKNGGASPAIPFTKSASVKYPPNSSNNSGKKTKEKFGRSSSTSRSRQLFHSTDFSSLQQEHPHLETNKRLEIDGAENKHFVLVHGGGFGAWCWYKTITLLTESGFSVDAVDLTASGVHPSGTSSVQSITDYTEPLINLLHNLDGADKVILVGHDIGGACVSYAMELFPSKIAKSVFVSAPMPKNGQSILDIFSHEEGPISDLMKQAQKFDYGNGKDQPPTAVNLDKQYLKDLLFNQTPAKDVALASVSMRPIPFAPILEKLSLTEANYGSVRRFYVETLEDRAVSVSCQEYIVNSNPPEKVLQLKGADHAPFLSKPQGLHKLLVEIAKLPDNKV